MEAVFAVEPTRRLHRVPADGALVAADVGWCRPHTLQLNEPGRGRRGQGSGLVRAGSGEVNTARRTIQGTARD